VERNLDHQPYDLRAYARILWRRKWIFLATAIALPVAVYVVASTSAKTYQASTLIEIEPTAIDQASGATAGGPTAQFIAIAARLIQTTGVAEAAARQLAPPRPSAHALLNATKTGTDPNTGFITITSQANTPARAAEIANAFGTAINSTRAAQAVQQLDLEIGNLAAQLHALPRSAFTQRNQVSSQLQRLRAQRAAQGSNATVIEPASPVGSPVSPHPARDAVLGLIVGVLLGIGLVALTESLDRRVRRPEGLEELTGLPILGTLPRSAFNGPKGAEAAAEQLRGVRAALPFFSVDRDIRSIVIASARSGEGKSLVASGLARAYAAMGADVILVDADLRRPSLGMRLGVSGGAGLAEVLVGKASPEQTLLRNSQLTTLRVLPAGEVPPNPAELLASRRMQELLDELSSMCDHVIIDTSPLLAVSDALPLVYGTSGTLLVARLGVVQRDDLRQLVRLTKAAAHPPLGLVVTGASDTRSYPYYSGTAGELATPSSGANSSNGKSADARLVAPISRDDST
jgi:polysaccharide biosynthesis transport protein